LDYPITTGPLEGINNKIKVLKCGVYGSREEDESFDFDLVCNSRVQIPAIYSTY
jgi:hypothetical protein